LTGIAGLSEDGSHGQAVSRNLIRIWVKKLEAGAFDKDARAVDLLQEYEAKIARRSSAWSAGRQSKSSF
jgi:hypothetical protein